MNKDELNWSGWAYKHHIAFDFEHNNIPTYPNGVGKGGTIFLTLEELERYASNNNNTRWYVAKLKLDKAPLKFEFDNPNMATILVDWEAEYPGFIPLEEALSSK